MIRLSELSHVEAREKLRGGLPAFVLVNPVEYHGPHLPLRTDAIISFGLMSDLAERLGGAPILGADLEVGVEPVPGPGTRSVSFETVCSLAADTVDALIDLGAKGLVLMTFHGSPLHSVALSDAVARARARGVPAIAPLNLLMTRLRDMMPSDLEGFREAVGRASDPRRAEALLSELPTDYHAGFFETSLVLHYSPSSVASFHSRLRPCPPIRPVPRLERWSRRTTGALSRELKFAALGLGWYQLDPFPGYTGQPAMATASAGESFARALTDLFEAPTRKVLREGAEPPAPIMEWTRTLTLRGRIQGIPKVRPAPLEALLLD
ncbi:MAG: creatininase family protein [Deltaproteobacteria bacterium]|nr:creatininase family protein [Deltaproteobacteria bacterium]